MLKKINKDINAFVPVVIAFYAIVGLGVALAYVYVIGAFAFAIGFAATGIVGFARRKWLAGVISTIMVIASLLYAYGFFTGVF